MSNSDDLAHEISRLISRFGAAVVRDETKRLCGGKAGNKTKADFPYLMEEFGRDARDWLAGRDPMKIRTNYSIAKGFSERCSGSSKVSVRKRIERKLRHERKRAMLVGAFWIAERELPFGRFFEVAELAAQLGPNVRTFASFRRMQLEKYRALFGEPSNELTIAEIITRLDMHIPSPPVNIFQILGGARR